METLEYSREPRRPFALWSNDMVGDDYRRVDVSTSDLPSPSALPHTLASILAMPRQALDRLPEAEKVTQRER